MQLPIPPLPLEPPSPVERVFGFCIAYLLVLSLVLLTLPQRWLRRVIQVDLRGGIDGEAR